MSEISGNYEEPLQLGYSSEVANKLRLAYCQLVGIRKTLGIAPNVGFTDQQLVLIEDRPTELRLTSLHAMHLEVTMAAASPQGEPCLMYAWDLSADGFPWQVSEFDGVGQASGVLSLDDEQLARMYANNLQTALFYYAEDLGSSYPGSGNVD